MHPRKRMNMLLPQLFARLAAAARLTKSSTVGPTPDASGNSNHGTLAADAAITDSGRYGKALTLDGADDHVQIPDDTALELGASDFTIEAWVNPDTTTDIRAIIAKWDNTDRSYKLDLRNGKLTFLLSPDGTSANQVKFEGATTLSTGA